MDAPDSLEGWIAIREDPFHTPTVTPPLRFHVCWNHIDRVVSVTCRDVTCADGHSGWSRALTPHQLRCVHKQLCLVRPSLHDLPRLPAKSGGIWSHVTRQYPDTDAQQKLEHDLQCYLVAALDTCGRSVLLETLYGEPSTDDYFEHISELRRRLYDDAVAVANDCLLNVLFLRDHGSVNMLDMQQTYTLEDDAIYRYNIALAALYNYLMQPFLDLREIAAMKVREANAGLANISLVEHRMSEYSNMHTEWQTHYTCAVDSIQQLYIEYYGKTITLLTGVRGRMLEDQKKFGKNTFKVAAQERFNRTSEDLHLEKLQLLRNTKKVLENERDKVKQKMVKLQEEPENIAKQLESLEAAVYRCQVKVHDLHLEILSEDEALLKLHVSIIRQQQEELENEVCFFDALETPEDLSCIDDVCSPSEENPRLRQLRSKLTMIYRKRASVRNKKKVLVTNMEAKKQQIIDEELQFRQHHEIKLKQDERKANEEKKQTFIDDERMKTMNRLRKYKLKYSTPATIQPRQRASNVRKTSKNNAAKPTKATASKGDTYLVNTTVDAKTDGRKMEESSSESVHNLTYHSDSPDTRETILQVSESLIIGVPPPPPPLPPPSLPPPPPPPLPPVLPPPSILPHPPSTPPHHSQTLEDRPQLDVDSLDLARSKLKKTSLGTTEKAANKKENSMSDMLNMIRSGVKLQPVAPRKQTAPPCDKHTQQLLDVFERISKRLQLSDDDESENDDFED